MNVMYGDDCLRELVLRFGQLVGHAAVLVFVEDDHRSAETP